MLKNEILNVDGTNWLIREAVSREAALNTIAHARCFGSIGGKDKVTGTDNVTTVRADVVRLNDDGTECLPYGAKGGTDHSALVDLAHARVQADRLGRAHEQALLRNRVYAGALAQIEAWITAADPIYQDAAFLRAEIAKEIAGARATIAEAKAEAQKGA